MNRMIVLGVSLLPIVQAAPGAEDARTRIELPEPMQQHMLANMRGHLSVLDEILASLACPPIGPRR